MKVVAVKRSPFTRAFIGATVGPAMVLALVLALVLAFPGITVAEAKNVKSTKPKAAKPKVTKSKPKTAAPQGTVPSLQPQPQPSSGGKSQRWVNAYHVGYQSELWPADRIDFESMTHFVVGRLKPRSDGSIATDFDIDDVKGPAFAADMAARARKANRIPLLMLGGAGEHDAFAGALSPANRERFVNDLLALSDKWGYAGFELDFEPLNVEDEPTIEWFVNELHRRRPAAILTLPVGWLNPNTDTVRPFYVRIAKSVDQFNVMTYGMSGPWGWPTWHSSALTGGTPQTPSSVESSVDMYLAAGVPSAKIGVGVGFFGQCWTVRTGPRQAQENGALSAEDSAMSSANIAAEYLPQMQRQWDAQAQVPYLTSQAPAGRAGCQYISYEDTQSVAAKGAFVKKKRLGGVIIWTAGQGYIASTGTNPMLTATYEAVAR
jgi:chitinase